MLGVRRAVGRASGEDIDDAFDAGHDRGLTIVVVGASVTVLSQAHARVGRDLALGKDICIGIHFYLAETREQAQTAFDHFQEKYEAKYAAACECLKKDRDVLLAFYDFPAEHWKHLRTTNPIESTFSTIRLRHRRTKGSGTRRTSLAMMFKLAQSAQKGWRRLNGHEKIIPLIQGKTFVDGVLQDAA